MTYATEAERQAFISGLRELAAFLESNPEVPAPKYADVLVSPPHPSDAENRSEIDLIASRIGSGTQTAAECQHYTTSRRFGPVEYRAVAIPADDTEEK